MIFQNLEFQVYPSLLHGGIIDISNTGDDFKFGGIYGAVCLDNEKIYIGSTCSLKRRIGEHLRDLQRGSHINHYLQRAFNKYSFFWFLVERLEDQDQYAREQYYIDLFQSYNATKGFNLNKFAHRPPIADRSGRLTVEQRRSFNKTRQKGSEILRIKDPSGNIHVVEHGITEFSEIHGLSLVHTASVLRGDRKQHKGWTLPETSIENKQVFKIKSPTGEIFEFTNKMQFCKTHNLTENGLKKVLDGKYIQCKGWVLPNVEIPTKTLISPEGDIVTFSVAKNFAEERNLKPRHVQDFLTGNRKHLNGWSKPESL